MISELNLQQRFASGKVVAVYPSAIDVEMPLPLNDLSRVRINRDHWVDASQEWRIGQAVTQMFIFGIWAGAVRGMRDSHWFASLKWVDEKQNPWAVAHPDYPHEGKVFKAQVIRHAGERAAIVHLGDSLLEAFLPLEEIPDGTVRTLQELVPSGLLLQVVVTEARLTDLNVRVSVLRLIRERERRQGKGPHVIGEADPHTPFLRFVNPDTHVSSLDGLSVPTPKMPNWHDKGILLIDDDKQFGKHLVAWCKQFGASAWAVDTVRGVGELLHNLGPQITHILLDYDMGGTKVRAEYLTALKRRRGNTPIAVISGLPEIEAPEFAARSQMTFIPKPLPVNLMDQWLNGQSLPKWERTHMQPAPYWQTKTAALNNHLQYAIQAWLTAIQQQSHALACAWVRCFPPEYHVVDYIGFSTEQSKHLLNGAFDQTVVANALRTKHALDDSSRDKPKGIWPNAARQLWAIPLTSHRNSADLNDILLVFVPQVCNFPELHKATMPAWLGWWDSLLELQQAYITLEDDTTFAAQGRVWAATAHELRPLLQSFECNTPWDHEAAIGFWPLGKKLNQLVNGSLYNLRPYRDQQINLNDRLRTMAHTFLWQMIDRSRITTIFHLPPENLVVHLAPEILEHALINLIDNAAKACARRKWAKIEVRIFLDYENSELPLVIRVADQGIGMRPEVLRNLFKPRFSTSGEKGHGLGLYLCSNIISAIGGKFELKETWYWSGSVFEIRLPLLVEGSNRSGGESEADRMGG